MLQNAAFDQGLHSVYPSSSKHINIVEQTSTSYRTRMVKSYGVTIFRVNTVYLNTLFSARWVYKRRDKNSEAKFRFYGILSHTGT